MWMCIITSLTVLSTKFFPSTTSPQSSPSTLKIWTRSLRNQELAKGTWKLITSSTSIPQLTSDCLQALIAAQRKTVRWEPLPTLAGAAQVSGGTEPRAQSPPAQTNTVQQQARTTAQTSGGSQPTADQPSGGLHKMLALHSQALIASRQGQGLLRGD